MASFPSHAVPAAYVEAAPAVEPTPEVELDDEGRPVCQPGEERVVERGGIAFEVCGPGGWKLAAGDGSTIFLTSARVVLVGAVRAPRRRLFGGGRDAAERAPDATAARAAFAFPIAALGDAAFEQPIFGANLLRGVAPPLDGAGGDAARATPTRWRVWFMSGGCGSFLPLFFRLQESVRRAPVEAVRAAPVAAATAGTVLRASYAEPLSAAAVTEATATASLGADRSDPTTVWIDNAHVVSY